MPWRIAAVGVWRGRGERDGVFVGGVEVVFALRGSIIVVGVGYGVFGVLENGGNWWAYLVRAAMLLPLSADALVWRYGSCHVSRRCPSKSC